MTDSEMMGGLTFLLLFGVAVVICVLGISVLRRLREAPPTEPAEGGSLINPGCLLVGVFLLACAFFSTFFPYLALVPAALFSVRGVRAFGRGRLGRDAGIVLLLVGFSWVLLTVLQAATLLWERSVAGAPIRFDLFLSLPVIALVSFLGEVIQASLSRSQEPAGQ